MARSAGHGIGRDPDWEVSQQQLDVSQRAPVFAEPAAIRSPGRLDLAFFSLAGELFLNGSRRGVRLRREQLLR